MAEWQRLTRVRLLTSPLGLSSLEIERHRVSATDHTDSKLFPKKGSGPTLEDGRNPYVAVIAELEDIPYDEAKEKMDAALQNWGVTYIAYLEDDFFRCSSPDDMESRVLSWSRSRDRVVDMVATASGWDTGHAFRRMSEVERRWPRVSFPLFLTHSMYLLEDDEIADKVFVWDEVDETRRMRVAKSAGWTRDQAMTDMLRRQALFGLQSKYYMSYKAWELSDDEVGHYATRSDARALYDALNAQPDLVDDKLVFSRDFGELLGRRSWANRDTTFEEFQAFAEGIEQAFCKPSDSDQGRGVFVLDLPATENELRDTYRHLLASPPMLLEELIDQHPSVSAIYPDSVNTVRVMTLNDHGEVRLLAAAMRFGRLGITDNYSGSGVVSDVDLATGKLATPAVDNKGRIYQEHPATGQAFVGFQIPHWDQLRSLVEQAALASEGAKFVGWDVAICEDRVVIVEGNARPGTGLIQAPYAPYRVGRKYVFSPYEKALSGEPPEREVAEDEADFEFDLTEDGAVLTSCNLSLPVVHVPEFALGRPVVEIGPGAFEGNSTLRSVRLPSTVKRIRINAFRRCSELQGIYLGESVGVIGARAFFGCTSLRRITLPKSLFKLRNSVFEGCSSLQEVTLPARVREVETKLFAGCASLKSVLLPMRLRGIRDSAFQGCESLDSLNYYRPTGTNLRGTTRMAIRDGLPPMMRHLGANAFRGCSSLEAVSLPAGVRGVADGAFQDCASLREVLLHNGVRSVGSRAFAGCERLSSIRLPLGCKSLAGDAFDPGVLLRSPAGSHAEGFAARHGLRFEPTPREPSPRPTSKMVPPTARRAPFFSPEQERQAAEHFEVRPSPVEPTTHILDPREALALGEDAYSRAPSEPGRARIVLLGDLMARPSQIRSAWNGVGYDFGRSLGFARPLLVEGDLVIGSLDTLLSDEFPYSDESALTDPTGYANAPSTYARALRAAGVDAVAAATDHAYDLGVRGVLGTLESLNEAGIAHTGLYASTDDRRFQLFDLSDIRVSLHSFMPEEANSQKSINFTTRGRKALFSYSKQAEVFQQLSSAKELGADFSVAYCRWGNSKTREVSEEQRSTGQLLADAGADLIIGVGPHCLQQYETLTASDGRVVPVLWSAGNFLSDMSGTEAYLEDSLILEATVQKGVDGRARLDSVRYRPCTLLDLGDENKSDYAVTPVSLPPADRPWAPLALDESRRRTQSHMQGALLPAQQPNDGLQQPSAVTRRVSYRINAALDSLSDVESPLYKREHFCEKRELDPIVLGKAAGDLRLNVHKFGPLFSVFESGGRGLPFYMHMSTALSKQDRDATNNKALTREILTAAGVPVMRGTLVASPAALQQAFEEIGPPLVVKPEEGSFGRGVRLGIDSEEELSDAAAPILEAGENLLVEEMFLGIDLRIAVVDGEARAATFRVPANVIGDGVSTIAELVKEKNAIRSQNDYISHQSIKFTSGILEFLEKTGKSVDTVPSPGERVFLHHVANISAGGDSYEVIDRVHPDLKALAVRTAALFPSALHSGVDILAQRLDVGLDQQRAVVCEVNLNNELPLHTHPVAGEPTALAHIELPKHWEKEARPMPGIATALDLVEYPSMQPDEVTSVIALSMTKEPVYAGDPTGAMRQVEGDLLSRALAQALPGGTAVRMRDSRFLTVEAGGCTSVLDISGNNMAARAVAKWPAIREAIGAQYRVPVSRTFQTAGEVPEDFQQILKEPKSLWTIQGETRVQGLSPTQVLDELRCASGRLASQEEVTIVEEPTVARCDVLTRGSEPLAAQLSVPFGVLGDGVRKVEELVAAALARREQNPVRNLRGVSADELGLLQDLPKTLADRVLPKGEWLELGSSFSPFEGALVIGLDEVPRAVSEYAVRIAGFVGSPGIMTHSFGLAPSEDGGLRWMWLRGSSEPRLSRFKFPHYGTPYDGFEEHAEFLRGQPRLKTHVPSANGGTCAPTDSSAILGSPAA